LHGAEYVPDVGLEDVDSESDDDTDVRVKKVAKNFDKRVGNEEEENQSSEDNYDSEEYTEADKPRGRKMVRSSNDGGEWMPGRKSSYQGNANKVSLMINQSIPITYTN
jgi:hypothetical protein